MFVMYRHLLNEENECIIYVKNIPIYVEKGILDCYWNKNIKLALTLLDL